MTGVQLFFLGAVVGSGIGVFAASSHILPALRRGAAYLAGRIRRH